MAAWQAALPARHKLSGESSWSGQAQAGYAHCISSVSSEYTFCMEGTSPPPFFFFMASTDFPEFMPKKPGGRLHGRRGFWFICQHFLPQLWRSTENCLLGFTNVSSAKKRNPPYSNMSPETSFHKYYMLHNPENTCGCCKCFLSWY